ILFEGDSVTLYTGVEASKLNYITWYFNDTCIAQINGNFSHNCTDVQCNNGTERFRDRLKLDNQNGSLTIMDIRTTDSGVYTLQIICSSSSSMKRFNVTVFCDSDAVLNFPAVGICVIVVFLLMSATVTAGVIYCRQKKYKPQIMKM
uniref:Zgc:171490 n=1 Tax=Cyprinus carpio TaxID=7962 RepID=A0A8C1Z5X7_CYPCA